MDPLILNQASAAPVPVRGPYGWDTGVCVGVDGNAVGPGVSAPDGSYPQSFSLLQWIKDHPWITTGVILGIIFLAGGGAGYVAGTRVERRRAARRVAKGAA